MINSVPPSVTFNHKNVFAVFNEIKAKCDDHTFP